MIIAHINSPTTFWPLTGNEIGQQALEWIKANAHSASEGIYELRDKDMFVNVHSYKTLPDHLCCFESHRQYIDLQYCISGGECIAWEPIESLERDGDYDLKKDFQFYKSYRSRNILSFVPGTFGVFFPEDGHEPKIFDGVNTVIKKLVIKIRKDLIIYH